MQIPAPHSRRSPRLTLFDTLSLAIGIIVGASIFKVSPAVFSNVTNPWFGMAAWLAGGGLSLVGALCFAELAAAYPRSGGQYVYLSRAFGPWLGFLFAWAQLVAIITGTIGAMAYVFADYALALLAISPSYGPAWAVAAIVGLTALNLLGVVVGKTAQNILTVAKILGLIGIITAGMLIRGSTSSTAPTTLPSHDGMGLALIFVLYAYGGWSDVAYVTAESRHRRRNIPLTLMLSVGGVTLVYLAVNAAYLAGLGFAGLRDSTAPASDVLTTALGPVGGQAMSLLVMVSALGAINGMIFAGARVYTAMGNDHPLFARLARWSPRWDTPAWSLIVQAGIALALVAVVGTIPGRRGVDLALGWLGFQALPWIGMGGGFELLVTATAPVFWLFLYLTGAGLIVLRVREPNHRRPFRVPLFPILPLIFCATSLYMLHAAVDYAGALALLGAVPLGLGVPLYWLSRSRGAAGE